MDVDHPERDRDWDDRARAETETERLDRNWSILLQELRVTQTGVQLLTGFLLTLPFQQRFDRLDDLMRGIYAATVACSAAATLALVAPVAMHRVLFRQHRLKTLVSAAHRLAYAGLVLLGLALVGVTLVVFDVVYDRGVATVAGAIVLGAFAMLWVMLPLLCAESGKAPRSRRAERIPRMFAYLVGQRCPLHRDPDRGIRLRLRLVGLALSTLELASGTGGGACPPMDHHHGSSRYGRSVVTKEVVSATGVTLRKRT